MSWWSATGAADLLEKNLIEIQNLRQRLEDSVCINDRLQERLEHALSNLDQGKRLLRVFTGCYLYQLAITRVSTPPQQFSGALPLPTAVPGISAPGAWALSSASWNSDTTLISLNPGKCRSPRGPIHSRLGQTPIVSLSSTVALDLNVSGGVTGLPCQLTVLQYGDPKSPLPVSPSQHGLIRALQGDEMPEEALLSPQPQLQELKPKGEQKQV
nr:uncharacterized protein LOC123480702 [Desmodus rotundus]